MFHPQGTVHKRRLHTSVSNQVGCLYFPGASMVCAKLHRYLPCLPPALEFRQSLGGERKINEYCQSLAEEGGKRMAEILGTSVMDTNPPDALNRTAMVCMHPLSVSHYVHLLTLVIHDRSTSSFPYLRVSNLVRTSSVFFNTSFSSSVRIMGLRISIMGNGGRGCVRRCIMRYVPTSVDFIT